ncbi:bacteriocin fulvocin C-related protein [Actinokineospora sp. UTMC 2448]|uniref:bacteriocin fulvocin C-related protein n=1 Tax=Actinokineospora sp. UTMC 2448 TaxID=2268449 RepID=UPI0021647AF5|nr:bacteriocin fulvocin C-related protein [Actinokineospora sp. UTMC 2448]UVS79641.1 hypothetical protein Actkin_03391 [Actinokineospora sp. UTMC 2448]
MIQQRWVLAFDAACATCRQLSDAVARACDGKLEILPLSHPEVVAWRSEDAPWAPTLVRVRGDQVRVWTGPGMALPLVRWLGFRSTVRVLQALGELRRSESDSSDGMGRKQFLRLGAGTAVAAAILVGGRVPAFGDTDAVQTWMRANRDRLPRTYGEIVKHPTAYRRAILAELPASTRSAVWVEHIDKWVLDQPGLTRAQADAVAAFRKIAATESTFAGPVTASVHGALTRARESAVAAFGQEKAFQLMAELGPADEATVQDNCTCNTIDNWCVNPPYCRRDGCTVLSSGCGALYIYACTGRCYY